MLKHFTSTDRLLFSLATVTLVVLSYFLYDDSLLVGNDSAANLTEIGQLAQKTKDVRRKSKNNFSWSEAETNDVLFKGDSIFTGEQSQALVSLTDGSELQILENSLVVLNFQNNQMSLDLKYGNFVGEIAENSTLKVKSNNEEFEIQKNANDNKPTKIQISKPKSKISSPKQQLQILSSNAILKPVISKKELTRSETIKETKLEIPEIKPEIPAVPLPPIEPPKIEAQNLPAPIIPDEELKITLQEPQDKKEYYKHTNPKIQYLWNTNLDHKKFIIEVSKNAEFTDVIKKINVEQKGFTLETPLASGKYYWRVSAINENNISVAASEVRDLSIIEIFAPIITSPQHKEAFNFKLNINNELLQASDVIIRWTDKPTQISTNNPFQKEKNQYEYQLSEDLNFKKLLETSKTSELNVKTKTLKPGTYFTRVKKYTENNIPSPWSNTVSFSIKHVISNESLPAPILTKNRIDFNIPIDAKSPPIAEESPVFEWKGPNGAMEYIVEVSENDKFTTPQTRNLNENKIAWVDYNAGKTFFRVFAKSKNGKLSASSQIGELNVNAPKPKLSPVTPIQVDAKTEDEKAPAKDFKLIWTKIPFADSYEVEIASKDAEVPLKKKFSVRTPASVYTLNAPGEYAWRVKALDKHGKQLSDYSDPGILMYKFNQLLISPKLLEPKNKSVVQLNAENNPFLWLEWKTMKNASHYYIEISKDPNFITKITSARVTGKRYLLNEQFHNIVLYWRVRAEIGDQKSDWSEIRKFKVLSDKKK